MQPYQQLQNIYKKLQQVAKQYDALQKENEQLQKEMAELEQKLYNTQQQLRACESKQSLNMLSATLNEEEKKQLQKRINVYLKEIEKCLSFFNS